ncbi:MAG: hypothetical protein Q9182_007148 [Xanthomendoza sp. 2 TL-2023]
MLKAGIQHDLPALPPPDVGPRASLLPFLADHHLPYVVPALFYWVISFIFHYVDTRGLFSKYKLHTSAEDLTKNRASRKDVIKFALIQQAAQCTLGYLMADDSEQFVSPQYAIAAWAQKLRYCELLLLQCIEYAGFQSAFTSKGSGPMSQTVIWQDDLGRSLSNSTTGPIYLGDSLASFSDFEVTIAKALYWVLIPLFQYLTAMVLADTFQYFTHRAFHVNKWLYSKQIPSFTN